MPTRAAVEFAHRQPTVEIRQFRDRRRHRIRASSRQIIECRPVAVFQRQCAACGNLDVADDVDHIVVIEAGGKFFRRHNIGIGDKRSGGIAQRIHAHLMAICHVGIKCIQRIFAVNIPVKVSRRPEGIKAKGGITGVKTQIAAGCRVQPLRAVIHHREQFGFAIGITREIPAHPRDRVGIYAEARQHFDGDVARRGAAEALCSDFLTEDIAGVGAAIAADGRGGGIVIPDSDLIIKCIQNPLQRRLIIAPCCAGKP